MIMRITTYLATTGLPKTYWTDSKMNMFWDYVKWFLTFNMKWIMMFAALGMVGLIVAVIMYIPVYARRAQQDENDDDELEVKYYR